MLQTDLRRKALDQFAQLTGTPSIDRLVQSGRETETATYRFELTDGRHIAVGTVKTLWSQTECSKVFAVAVGHPFPPIKTSTWDNLRTRLLTHAVEVEETPGESFADTVREWLGAYAENAGSDRDGAARARRPFIENGDIHVCATSFCREIRRMYSASVKEREIKAALREIGFIRRAINYTGGASRTQASYYVGSADLLNPGDLL